MIDRLSQLSTWGAQAGARPRDLAGVEVGEDLVEQVGERIAGAAGVGLVALRISAASGVGFGLVVGLYAPR
jgi:hypothetical protein